MNIFLTLLTADYKHSFDFIGKDMREACERWKIDIGKVGKHYLFVNVNNIKNVLE